MMVAGVAWIKDVAALVRVAGVVGVEGREDVKRSTKRETCVVVDAVGWLSWASW